jgi:hypothetical protein
LCSSHARKAQNGLNRQYAFGVVIPREDGAVDRRDLKRNCFAKALRWFRFRLRSEDMQLFDRQRLGKLLDLRQDPFAGVLRESIGEHVRKHGKLNDAIAHWLSKQVPMPPTDPALARGAYVDEGAERERRRRCWSKDFPDDEGSTHFRLPST